MKTHWFWLLLCLLSALPLLAGALARPALAGQALRVYGPGGPYLPVKECAAAFAAKTGVSVEVVKGQPDLIAPRLAEDGDVHYTGAEYMLKDFIQAHPGVIDEATAVNLYPRRIGILVRQGNPKGIREPADLHRPGVKVLDVALESMETLRGDAPGKGEDIAAAVTTGEEGFTAWKARPDLDAWVTYRSWQLQATDTDFVPIPGRAGERFTPAALTRRSQNREAAVAFLAYLQSEEAHRIFQKYGWE